MIKYDRFAGGKHFSVTFSYDDGNIADRRLCGIFDKYKLKATFNLISGRFGGDVVSEGEIKELYKNHEIAGIPYRILIFHHCRRRRSFPKFLIAAGSLKI